MRQRFKVILDCDDILVHCNEMAINKLNKEFGTNYNIYDIKSWGMTGKDLDKRIAYFSDPNFMNSLPPIEGAREFIQKLMHKAEVFIMTSVEPQCASMRFNYIMENFPEINPNNIIIGGRKDLVRADMMLDDAPHNLEKAQVTYPVLFQRPWNFATPGILSVNGYDEFLQLVDIIKASDADDSDKYDVVSLVGPSGSGKKKLAESLLNTGKFVRVKTYTTKDSSDYHVLTFPEFTQRKEEGFFSETSVYMGEFYGLRTEDVEKIKAQGKIPLMILDINGAVSMMRHFSSLNVFVKASKEACIKEILSRDLHIDEAVQRIASLDIELKNEELCDITVSCSDISEILQKVGVA